MIEVQKMYVSTSFSKIMRLNIRLQTCLWLCCLMIACGADPSDPAQEEKKPVELSLAEISQVNDLGQNLLHKAVLENDIELLQAGVATGFDLNGRDKSGNTALHYALRNKNHEALKILIDHGADLSLPLPNGDSPLKFAVTGNDVIAAESLHLCDRNQDILLTKDSAIRPLAIEAVKNKHISLAELFIRPVHYIVKRDRPEYLAHLLAVEKGLLNQEDEKEMTPLHVAYYYQNTKFIELLIAAGANEQAVDIFGKRPAEYGSGSFGTLPEICTLDEKKIIKIEDKILDFLSYHEWLTIGIVKDGQIAYLKSYGNNDMIDQDAVHASVSKAMTSIIFLQLLKEGAIRNLDDDIAAYCAKYRDVMPAAFVREKITFRHILTHTSGIPHINKPLWLNGKLNLLFKPGARFEYSSNAFSILGEVMSEVKRKSFSDLVKDYIGRPVDAPSFWAEAVFRAPAARIHSTTRDFVKFAVGIINNTYISEYELDNLLVGKNKGESLGWGASHIGTEDLTLGHSGSNGKPRSHLVIKPKKKIALVLMGETKTKDSDIWFLNLAPILMDIVEGKGGY